MSTIELKYSVMRQALEMGKVMAKHKDQGVGAPRLQKYKNGMEGTRPRAPVWGDFWEDSGRTFPGDLEFQLNFFFPSPLSTPRICIMNLYINFDYGK